MLSTTHEGLDRRQRHHSVLALMGAVQRKEDVVIVPAKASDGEPLAADPDLTAQYAELVALKGNRRPNVPGTLDENLGNLRLLKAADDGRTGLDDARLLRGNVLQRRAEEPYVVKSYRCHDCYRGVDDVGGVPGATHAHLDNGHVEGCVGEGGVCDGHEDLEVRHSRRAGRSRACVDDLDEGKHVFVGRDEPLSIDRVAVQRDPFADVVKVW